MENEIIAGASESVLIVEADAGSTRPTSLVFTVGDRTVGGNVTWLTDMHSPHTMAALARVRLSFVVRGDAGQREALALERVARDTGVRCAPAPGVPASWTVLETTVASSGLPPFQPFRHEWELLEREPLHAYALVMNGERFTTRGYAEILAPAGLVIVALIATRERTHFAQMIRDGDALSIVREGVSRDVREMHLEYFLWSDAAIPVALVQLAERDPASAADNDGLSRCEAHRLRRDLACLQAAHDALLDALASQSTPTASAIAAKADLSWPEVFLRQTHRTRLRPDLAMHLSASA